MPQVEKATELANYYRSRLCFETQSLTFEAGGAFSRLELILLHHFMLGTPRKDIGKRLNLSVKAIEKRLTGIRQQGLETNPASPSLQYCLNTSGLAGFLLLKEDWFAE